MYVILFVSYEKKKLPINRTADNYSTKFIRISYFL